MNNVVAVSDWVKSATTLSPTLPPHMNVYPHLCERWKWHLFKKIHYFFEKLGWTCFFGCLPMYIHKNNFQGHVTQEKDSQNTARSYWVSRRSRERQGCPPPWVAPTHQLGDASMASHHPPGSPKLGNIRNCLSCQAFQTLMWRIKYINHNW